MRLKLLIQEERTGGYTAVVPALPGCVTCADTLEDVRIKAKEVAAGWLEANACLNDTERVAVLDAPEADAALAEESAFLATDRAGEPTVEEMDL